MTELEYFERWHAQRWPKDSLARDTHGSYIDPEVNKRAHTWFARSETFVGTAQPRFRNRAKRRADRQASKHTWAVFSRILIPEHSVRYWDQYKTYVNEQDATNAARDLNRDSSKFMQYLAYPLHMGEPSRDIPNVVLKIGDPIKNTGFRIFSRFISDFDRLRHYYVPWLAHPQVHETSSSAFLAIPDLPPYSSVPGVFEYTIGRWPGLRPTAHGAPARAFKVKGTK